ncbi:AAA family ATPase, partial [Acidithiobacillus sp. VAN18-1]
VSRAGYGQWHGLLQAKLIESVIVNNRNQKRRKFQAKNSNSLHFLRTILPLVIFTVGTSASGKSTWARAMQAEHPLLNITIIERDAIRESLHRSTAQSPFSWSAWDRSLEDTVQRLWEEQITDALAGCNPLPGCNPCKVPTPCESPVVIISDTNL